LNGSISKEGNSSQPWKKLPQMLKLIKRVSSKKMKANIRKLSVNFLATTKNSKGLMNLKRKSENNTKFKEKKFRLKLIRKSRKQLPLEVWKRSQSLTLSQITPEKALRTNAWKTTQENKLKSALLRLRETWSGITWKLISPLLWAENRSENRTKKAETVWEATSYPPKPQYAAERSLYISPS
jgi:hypothetical protein